MFNILIVEDDTELGHLFRRVLEKNGYEVISACDGVEQCGFSHIGDTNDHDPECPGHAFRRIPFDFLVKQLPHGGGKLTDALTTLAISSHGGDALFFEIGCPTGGGIRVRQIQSV